MSNCNYYTCEICDTLNSCRRFSCQNCGTIPARYSFLKKPSRLIHEDMITVVRAIGASHAYPKISKIGLRTVRADYYAE